MSAPDGAGAADLAARRQELLRRALADRGLGATAVGRAAAPARGPRLPAPLSSAQRRMWFLHRLAPDDPAYHLTIGVRLSGELEPDRLRAAFEDVTRRHEVLRSVYRGDAPDTAVQVAAPDSALLPFEIRDLPPGTDPDSSAETAVRAWSDAPFDLAEDLPLRLLLLRRGPREHLLFLTIHHIACDDLSWEILLGQVSAAYCDEAGAPADRQYADFARWEADELRGAAFEESRGYWRRLLAGPGGAVRLPADQPRPARAPRQGVRRRAAVSREAAEGIRALARTEQASPYMVLLTAAALLLRRHGATGRVPFGTPVVRRPRPEFEPLIGNFGNVMVLPVDVGPPGGEGPAFTGLLARVRALCAEAYAHQHVPFETVVEDARPDRGGGAPRLFDVMFSYRSSLLSGLDLPGVRCAEYPLDPGTARFDLVLDVADDADGTGAMTVTVTARTDMFTASTTQRLADRFAALIEELAAGAPHGAVPSPTSQTASYETVPHDAAPPRLAGTVPQQRLPRPAGDARPALPRQEGTPTMSAPDSRTPQTPAPAPAHQQAPGLAPGADPRPGPADGHGRAPDRDPVTDTARVTDAVDAVVDPGPDYDPELDIAIVGMAGRFPGATSLDDFWAGLAEGREAAKPFTDEEFVAAGNDPRELADPNLVKVEAAVDGIDLFDADFFGFRPTEAELLDPQQRLFLECAYHALQQAGCAPREYDGLIGVYAGASQSRYFLDKVHPHIADAPNSMALLPAISANSPSSFATRVCYELGLTGPGISVSTACSTSLVALHLACRDLLDHSCDVALAGGASLNPSPRTGYHYLPDGPLSPDGRCRSFDAAADGMFPGDGVGVLVLKRLADALADGDTIRAVVKGSAVNNDGDRKAGFSAPSAAGQTEVILAAHAAAGVAASAISYVEAHGTGTPVGDPIELQALLDAFATDPDTAERPGACAIGSVKTNVGHLDAAAGVAGVIKTVLALEHEAIPPSLHFERANPLIPLDGSPFRVATGRTPWQRVPGEPRRAGVSSFGIGGTNAHVILQEAPVQAAHRTGPPSSAVAASDTRRHLFTLSAKSPQALADSAAELADHLAARPWLDPHDVAHTLRSGREEFAYRRAVTAPDLDTAVRALREGAGSAGEAADGRQVALLFPGGGTQFAGMGAELYGSEPEFRAALDACASVMVRHGRDLHAELAADGGGFVGVVATGYAIARQLAAYGVTPVAMLGHSLGEYTAACLAGVISLDDVLPLVAERERLMLLAGGATLSVLLSEEQLRGRLTGGLGIAAVNGPLHCSVSGPADEIDALERQLVAEGVDHSRLRLATAVHSGVLDAMLPEYAKALARVTLRAPRTPLISNLTGAPLTADQATDPGYWLRHTRETVRFADGLAALHDAYRPVLLEVGPGRGLTRLAGLQLGRDAVAVSAMRHPRDGYGDAEALLAALGHVWTAGGTIGRHAPYDDRPRRRIPLPGYAFQRRRFWMDAPRRAVESGTYLVPDGLREPAFGRALELAAAGSRLLVTDPAISDPVAADPAFSGPTVTGPGAATPAVRSSAVAHIDAAREAGLLTEDDELLRGRIKVEHPPADLQRDLDTLCARYILRFLHGTGVRTGNGARSTADAIAATVGVVPAYRPFLDAMLAVLAEDGHLVRDTDGAVTFRTPPGQAPGQAPDPDAEAGIDALEAAVLARHPDRADELALLRRCADRYPEVLGGTVPGHQVLLPDGSDDISQEVVDQRVGTSDVAVHTRLVAQAVARLARQAEGGRLRVLEVGAGRGYLTWDVADALKGIPGVEYHFTDLGRSFVLAGQRTAAAKDIDFMRFGVLDISADPAPQGYEAGGFDVVLAFNVLHATPDLRTTVGNVRSLLGEGGRLFLLEATSQRRPSMLTAGLFEGWWYFSDDLREHSPLLPPAGWRALLADSGYDALEVYPGDGERLREADHALLTARRAGPAGAPGGSSGAASGETAERIRRLEAAGGRVEILPPDTAAALAGVAGALTDGSGPLVLKLVDTPAPDRDRPSDTPDDDRPEAGGGLYGGGSAFNQRPALATPYAEPRNDLERTVARAWATVLGIDRVGAHDDFFDLGGESLLAMQLITRLREELGVSLSVRSFFDAGTPTVAVLAGLVEESRTAGPGTAAIAPSPRRAARTTRPAAED
ncbi:condensation domain-containing protein [Actinacidiphila alni]|uniref:condensation domain-containing protein n=1 Tax=Actinacidiphila alni TaxID=380248 RepID=UPI0034568206